MATPHSPAHLGPKVDQAVELGAKVGAPVGERPPPRAPLRKHARNADGAHGVEVARVMDTANGRGRPRRGAARAEGGSAAFLAGGLFSGERHRCGGQGGGGHNGGSQASNNRRSGLG